MQKFKFFYLYTIFISLQAANIRYTYPFIYSYIDEFATILNSGYDKRFGRLFYTTVQSLMMGQWGPKHVRCEILKHCCN